MRSRFEFSVLCTSFFLAVLLIVGALLGKSEEQEGAYRPLAVYMEILARIKSDYVEEPDISKVTQGALQGLVEYLDPLSSYLSSEQYAEYQAQLQNPDGGSGLATGMIVRKQGNYTGVQAVLPGSPAAEAGIRADDLLDAIDNISTRVMPPAYLQALLSGEPGSSVTVMIRPSWDYDSPVEHTLVRSETPLPDVEARLLDGGIGYVRASVLDADRVRQIAEAVRGLEADGAAKLVLDLRGNAWGTPSEGVALANLFLDSGTIATLKGQNYPEKQFMADAESKAVDLPLAVIVDRPTSGGAEVAAAAIQQNERGQVVGEKSAGLAAAQDTIRLDDGAALILSVAKYYGPGGAAIHDEGVEPDRAVPQRELRRYREFLHRKFETPEARLEAAEKAGDPFLDKALEALDAA